MWVAADYRRSAGERILGGVEAVSTSAMWVTGGAEVGSAVGGIEVTTVGAEVEGAGLTAEAGETGAAADAAEASEGAGGACFVAGTKVQTASGEKNIEEVSAGDVVLSTDPERAEVTDRPSYQSVSRTFVRTAPVILDIHVGGQVISATPEHPFWVVGAGWTAAGELRRGSALLTKRLHIFY